MEAVPVGDPLFRVDVIASTPNPQQACWLAMHNDYSEGYVLDGAIPSEERAGEYIVRHCLAGGRGHFGVIEHPQITFAIGNFPHSVAMQARTHRIASFDVQSQRYTGKRVLAVADGLLPIDDVFYSRPVGHYHDRQGKRYDVTDSDREEDLAFYMKAAKQYQRRINQGWAEEHARDILPQSIRQNFIVSFNARSLCHFLDLRHKPDAQIEIQWLTHQMIPAFLDWMPSVAKWYVENRLNKGRLAP